jgi:hypothetical protein
VDPERRAVLLCAPLGTLMLVGGSLVALTATGGGVAMGAVVALMGAAFLLAVVHLVLPGRPVVTRQVGDATVIDGSPWPWRFLLVLAVGTTAAAVLGTIALGDPEVLESSSSRRSPVVLLALWPIGAWSWFVVVRGRTRQRIEVGGDVVTLHAGRRRTSVTATRRRVDVGRGSPARRRSVVVRGRVDAEELVLVARLFATTPDELADAVRAALPR